METPAQVMQAELKAVQLREIRTVGKQRRLAEVNHLSPRGISSNPGRRSSIGKNRSMFRSRRASVEVATDMMMEIQPWSGLDSIEWMVHWESVSELGRCLQVMRATS